ncbi:MAG: class I SAM-dependent methyltransferase [Deltaproteobacteria bacterium]|nr:class I SAM-dependent methyltransferase [Deltaproteobacteria bacterium]
MPKECKKALKSLEVGAGSGRLSRFLAERGYRTTCLDFSPQALKLAKKYYDAANLIGEFIEGEAGDMPFYDGEFDVVFSTGLLEHFEDPMPIIFEMVRVLRIGGLFYSDIVPKKFGSFVKKLKWSR